MKALYSNKTSFLTKRGFVSGSNLKKSDEIGYFDKSGNLVFTKDYTCIKEATILNLLSCGSSYVVCNTELTKYISPIYNLKDQKENTNRYSFSVNGVEYSIPESEYLTLCFLFLNYASYDSKKKELTYNTKNNHYLNNMAFYKALSLYYRSRSSESDYINFPYNEKDALTSFKCVGLINKEPDFIVKLLESTNSSKYFLKFLRTCGLIYSYHLDYFYINCKERDLSLILLFLITLTGCCGSIKEKAYTDDRGNSKVGDIVYFFRPKEISNRVCGPTYLLPSIGIKLGDNIRGTLITASTYKDHTSITFAPSYTEN